MLQLANKGDIPRLAALTTPILLFADELLSMPKAATGLQQQLDAWHKFCSVRKLSTSDTQIWCLNPRSKFPT